MKVLNQIYRMYLEVDGEFARQEHQARLRAYVRMEAEARSKREFYDQATFLYLFSRFEGRVNDYATGLIRTKRSESTKWGYRRSWDILDPGNIDRIPFMSRVAILTDKGRADYALIDSYYKTRNEIAHGDVWTQSFFIPNVYSDIRRLYAALRP